MFLKRLNQNVFRDFLKFKVIILTLKKKKKNVAEKVIVRNLLITLN